MRTASRLLLLLPVLSLGVATAAQDAESPQSETAGPPEIGYRFVKLANPDPRGAKSLGAVVHYPAAAGARRPRNAPLAPQQKPIPVIVFLHGFGATGGMMVSIGQHFAEAGSLPWRSNAQRLFDALQENSTFQAFWVLGEGATHVNVAVPSMLQRRTDPTFKLCAAMATAFFDRHLRGKHGPLEEFLDPQRKPAGVQQVLVRGARPPAARPDPSKGKRRIL